VLGSLRLGFVVAGERAFWEETSQVLAVVSVEVAAVVLVVVVVA